MVCHSIQGIRIGAGLGSYVIGIPAVMLDSSGKPVMGEVPDELILKNPDLHKKAVMRDIYRTPEFCGTCHKANLPQSLNGYKWIRAFNTWDEWQTSAYSGTSPLTFYGKASTSCQDCHMPPSDVRLSDMGAKEGCIPSHRWVGGNTAIPAYYGFSEQLAQTTDFLRDHKVAVDIFALRPVGPDTVPKPWQAPLGLAKTTVIPGSEIEMAVMIQNIGVGHSLIPEQRDIYEAWVKFVVADSDGKIIARSGTINSDGSLDPNAHSFTSRILDSEATRLDRHEVWKRHAVAADISLQAGKTSIVRYQFRIPIEAKGPLAVTATVSYRHFNETFTRFVLGDKHKEYPIIDMASQSRVICLGRDVPSPSSAPDPEEWRRWNNWGIGLLESQRYLNAVEAFQRVASLKPNGDALANIGLAYYLDRDPIKAGDFAEREEKRNPGDIRATFYAALAERDLGRYGDALSRLEHLARQYPNSIDVHREYAFTLLLGNRSDEAKLEYERVQQIDPDDIAAHYYLSSAYEQMGKLGKAEKEELAFRDKRDDPMMMGVALKYQRDHPSDMRESAPWHVHKIN